MWNIEKAGTVFLASGHPDFTKLRPTFCFVPDEFFNSGEFDRSAYMASRWPSINCSANENAIGSHIFPDPEKPVDPKENSLVFRNFLSRLETIAAIKSP
jgi:hypothetical protein